MRKWMKVLHSNTYSLEPFRLLFSLFCLKFLEKTNFHSRKQAASTKEKSVQKKSADGLRFGLASQRTPAADRDSLSHAASAWLYWCEKTMQNLQVAEADPQEPLRRYTRPSILHRPDYANSLCWALSPWVTSETQMLLSDNASIPQCFPPVCITDRITADKRKRT